MHRSRLLRVGASLLAAAAAFAVALWAPMPALPDAARGQIMEVVERRLPGWEVDRLRPSWEGGYTVVARCADMTLDFQLVPGHGLPSTSAWIRPADEEGMRLLGRVSDHWRYLVWHTRQPTAPQASCTNHYARPVDESGARAVTSID